MPSFLSFRSGARLLPISGDNPLSPQISTICIFCINSNIRTIRGVNASHQRMGPVQAGRERVVNALTIRLPAEKRADTLIQAHPPDLHRPGWACGGTRLVLPVYQLNGWLLSFHTNERCQNLITGGNDLGIGLKSLLGNDHFRKLAGNVHIGHLEILGNNLSQAAYAGYAACG